MVITRYILLQVIVLLQSLSLVTPQDQIPSSIWSLQGVEVVVDNMGLVAVLVATRPLLHMQLPYLPTKLLLVVVVVDQLIIPLSVALATSAQYSPYLQQVVVVELPDTQVVREAMVVLVVVRQSHLQVRMVAVLVDKGMTVDKT
jgi:hypothetical protein